MTDGASEGSRIRLVPGPHADRLDDRTRAMIIAAAEATAERTGVTLHAATFDDEGLLLVVDGPMLIAFGLAAEVRRSTDRWHRERTGLALWMAPDPPPDEPER
jgi:uncharacterized protein GlcG (DUF336 family)